MIGIGGEDFSEEFILGRFVCSLESAQEFIERSEDLLRKRRGYLILIFPALAQNCGQSARSFKCEQALRAEQHVERGDDRPPCDFTHRLYRECQIAGGLTAWSVDEPELNAVEQQSNRNFCFSKKTLESRLRSGMPAPVVFLRSGIEICCDRQFLDEKNPIARLVGIRDCKVRR